MAVPKKKANKDKKDKHAINPNVFKWTGQRKKAALLISEGTKNYEEIASEIGVHYVTFWDWRRHPIFQAEVSRLILANEKASREGLLRLAYKAIEEKIGNIADDRSTVLEWTKFIADLQGLMKQKIELDANLKHSTFNPEELTDEELQKVIDENVKKLAEAGYLQSVRND